MTMDIGGRTFTRDELAERIGNAAQLGGVRRCILNEGPAKGVEAIDVDTGPGGLRFTVLPDRGMDICSASYQGMNLVFLTGNGVVHPAAYDASGLGWLHTFFAGLLTTCGLTTLGAPGEDEGTALGLHGRYSALAATQVVDLSDWAGDDVEITLAGTVTETRLFAAKLQLRRTISTRIGSREVTIADRVENVGYSSAPFTILYHVNAGFPLLDACSRLALTSARIEAHDNGSKTAIGEFNRFSAPVPEFAEQNFLHLVEPAADGNAHAAMLNPELGLGLALSFDPGQLPYLNEWKQMGQGDYVVGIEPCNVPCANRGVLRRLGLLPMLEPGEVRETGLTLAVLDGADELAAFSERYDGDPAVEPFTALAD